MLHETKMSQGVIKGFLQEEFPRGDPCREDLEEIQKAANRARELTQQLLAFGRRQVLRPQRVDLNELLAGLERIMRGMLGQHVRLAWSRAPNLAQIVTDPGHIVVPHPRNV